MRGCISHVLDILQFIRNPFYMLFVSSKLLWNFCTMFWNSEHRFGRKLSSHVPNVWNICAYANWIFTVWKVPRLLNLESSVSWTLHFSHSLSRYRQHLFAQSQQWKQYSKVLKDLFKISNKNTRKTSFNQISHIVLCFPLFTLKH